LAFKMNVDKYSYSNSPEKNSQNYAAELAKKLVNDEAQSRQYTDDALRELIETSIIEESTERQKADNLANERISSERIIRENAINEIRNELITESEMRGEANLLLSDSIAELSKRLITEQMNRADTDTALQNNISAETYAREAIDIELKKLIDNEAKLRTADDEAIANSKADINHAHSAEEVGALPDTTEIPSKVSQLENDRGYLTEHQDISGKADKPIITTDNTTAYIFEFSNSYNTEVRLSEMSGISFTFGNGEYKQDYISGLSFDSRATPTAIDYTDSGILNWVGTDCTNVDGLSIFQPSANTHYDIVFYFNGVQFIGLVNGFVPATGNVVSV